MILRIPLLLTVLLAWPPAGLAPAHAQETTGPPGEQEGSAGEPEPGSHLEVFLVTAGPGDAIWERFSHNAIWIRDNRTGLNTAYNWGIFSFDQENFIVRLFQGRMLYAMYGLDMNRMAASYMAANRDLVVQPVDLDPAERLELQATLQAMNNDQDRYYRYDYYRDNCSTRVRDALDAVLGGQIEERWGDVATEESYRWQTRRALRRDLWAATGIDLFMGIPADRYLTAWEEMFLPLRAQRYLEETEIRRADGSVRPLLGPRQTLGDADRPPVAEAPRTIPWAEILIGIGLSLLLVALAASGAGGRKAGTVAFGLLAGLWITLWGVIGTLIVFLWTLTDHVFTYSNENLLQATPLHFVWALALFGALLSGNWEGAARWGRRLLALSLAGLVLQVLPVLDQVNGNVLALTVPTFLAVVWGARALADASEAPETMGESA
jgi:hypothetical protein